MYSEFLTLVHSGNVKAAGIDDSTDKIYFTMKGHSSEQTSVEATARVATTTPAAADSGALFICSWHCTETHCSATFHKRTCA